MFVLRNRLFADDRLAASWGLAWGDADGDGDMDLWVSEHGGLASLHVNRLDEASARFETVEIGPTGDKHGCAWADTDADGDQDLLQLRGGGRGGKVPKDVEDLGNQLFKNLGVVDDIPQLVWSYDPDDRTVSDGLHYPPGRGRTPTFLDVNLDGRLDVFIGNDARDDGLVPSSIFLQRRNGNFRLAPDALGIDGNGVDLAIPADFDGDGRLDLLLRGRVAPTSIVFGTGDGFAARGPALPEALRDETFDGEDLLVADFNNDGRPDIWLVQQGYGSLFLNLGGRFIDVSERAGLRAEAFISRNGAAGDFDNDCDVDVYLVNADYGAESVVGNLPNTVWENRRTATRIVDGAELAIPQFFARSGPGFAPSEDNGLGWSVAVAELDGDGRLDLVVANGANGPRNPDNFLVRGPNDLFLGNGHPDRDWLMVDLCGTVSNVEGIGAVVYATTEAGLRQMRTADNGVHDKTQNDPRLHFGFGTLDPSERIALEIRWPNGSVQQLGGIAPNQVLQVTEPARSFGSDPLRATAGTATIAGANVLAGGVEQELVGPTEPVALAAQWSEDCIVVA